MEQERIRVHPPGPFPPTGEELPGEVDLGIRLRDALYRRVVVLDARKALATNIRMASRSPHQLVMALPSIEAFLDTFPLAAMVDDAVASWKQEPTPEALTVLTRAAEVIGTVLGWPRTVDGRWPLPDEAWMRRQVDGPAVVVPRGPRDGAPATAVALDAVLGLREGIELSPRIPVPGDQLAARRDELRSTLEQNQDTVIEIEGWIPWDQDSQDAFNTLKETTPLQAAFSRCGLAALAAGGGGSLDEVLEDAPPGESGERLRPTCDVVILPNLGEDGQIDAHGVLVWDDRYRPVRVNPVVNTVMEGLREHPTIPELAMSLDSDEAVVTDVLQQLIEIGAVSAW